MRLCDLVSLLAILQCHSFVWFEHDHPSTKLRHKCFAITSNAWGPSYEHKMVSGLFQATPPLLETAGNKGKGAGWSAAPGSRGAAQAGTGAWEMGRGAGGAAGDKGKDDGSKGKDECKVGEAAASKTVGGSNAALGGQEERGRVDQGDKMGVGEEKAGEGRKVDEGEKVVEGGGGEVAYGGGGASERVLVNKSGGGAGGGGPEEGQEEKGERVGGQHGISDGGGKAAGEEVQELVEERGEGGQAGRGPVRREGELGD